MAEAVFNLNIKARRVKYPVDLAQAAMPPAFRFLRQPSRPSAPRPVAKSGRAAGNGVVAI
jgi:hypothetical protein